jgi:hypothetical protein
MKLFGRRPDDSPAEFWRKTGEKRGGTIGFMSFATLLGRSQDHIVDLPGLLYAVGGTVWFEDFERDNWFSRIVRTRDTYAKTEISFALADVLSTRLVTRGGALRSITGPVPPDALRPATLLNRIISTPIVQVAMRDGSSLFIDLINRKQFLALVAGAK